MFWYQNAYTAAAEMAKGVSVESVCMLIASLSAKQSWERNLEMAQDFLNGKEVNWKANRTGPKISAFYESIRTAGHTTEVCLDRHMASAASGRKLTEAELKKFFDSPRRRNLVRRHVAYLAGEHKIFPAQMQAILWVTWRSRHARKRAA